MAEYLPISEARQRLLQLEPEEGDEIVVTRNGRPVFSIVSHTRYRELESLVETAEILADKEFMEQLRQGIAEADRGETISWEEAKRELDL
jgi:prevent-host-death family protein